MATSPTFLVLLLLLSVLLPITPSLCADDNTDFTQVFCATCPFPFNKDMKVLTFPLGLRNEGGAEVLAIGMSTPDGTTANVKIQRSSAPLYVIIGLSYSNRERGFWNVIFDSNNHNLRAIITNGPTWAVKCNGETSCPVRVVSEPSLIMLYPFSSYELQNGIIAPHTNGANITAAAAGFTCSEWRITEGGPTGCLPEVSPVLSFFLFLVTLFIVVICCCGCCIVVCVIVLLAAGGLGGLAWGINYIAKDKKPATQANEPLLNEMQQQDQSAADPFPPSPSPSPAATAAPGGPDAPQVGLVYSNRNAAPPPVRQPPPPQQWGPPPPQQVPYTMMYSQPLQPQQQQQQHQHQQQQHQHQQRQKPSGPVGAK